MKTIQNVVMSLALTFSVPALAEATSPQNQENKHNTVHVVRGKGISMDELTAIADVSSARDEQGNSVALRDEGGYSIGSFTRGTITIVPVNGKAADVITLDLKHQPQ